MELSRMMKIVHILIMAVVTQLYKFIKIHRTVHQKGWILLYINYTSNKVTLKKKSWGRQSQQGPRPTGP